MATLYGKAAGGNWSAAGTWSNVNSAGADNSGPPTAADNVILELGTGTITIDAASACRGLDTTSGTGSFLGTLIHNAFTLSIGDGTTAAGNAAFKLNGGMTAYTLSNATSSKLKFVGSSGTVQTLDFGGKTTGDVEFSGTGSWIFDTDHTCGTTATVTLTQGTVNVNGKTCSWGLFNGSGAVARTLTLGAANITITGIGNCWTTATTTNLTLNSNTSVITLTGANSNFIGGTSQVYNTVNLNGAGVSVISSTSTYANFARNGSATKTDRLDLTAGGTVTGILTLAGNSSTNRLIVQSTTVGTAKTFINTGATMTISNTDFQDVTMATAWDASARTDIGDCGGNTGITFPPGTTENITMSTNKNWSDVTIYTSRVPLPQDTVTATGWTAGNLTVDMPRLGKNIDLSAGTAVSGGLSLALSYTLYGDFKLNSNIVLTGGGNGTLRPTGASSITMVGKSFGGIVNINATRSGASYQMNDALSGANQVLITGNFTSNNFSITGLSVNVSGITAGTLGTSTVTTTSTATGTVFTGGTGISFSTMNITVSGASANTRTLAGANGTFGTLTYILAGSTGGLNITGSNSFAAINFSDVTNARSLLFTAATTTTIRNVNGFNVFGTSGKNMTVDSITASNHTLTSANQQGGNIDYLTLGHSVVDASPKWYAGANSTDGGTNTNWQFTAAPILPSSAGSIQSVRNLMNLQRL